MYYYHYPWGWSFFGMNFLWWLFWLALLVAFFAMMRPVPRRGSQQSQRNRAFEILQRRYAAGELSTAEYEDRKARILLDQAHFRDTETHPKPVTKREVPPSTSSPSSSDPLPQH